MKNNNWKWTNIFFWPLGIFWIIDLLTISLIEGIFYLIIKFPYLIGKKLFETMKDVEWYGRKDFIWMNVWLYLLRKIEKRIFKEEKNKEENEKKL